MQRSIECFMGTACASIIHFSRYVLNGSTSYTVLLIVKGTMGRGHEISANVNGTYSTQNSQHVSPVLKLAIQRTSFSAFGTCRPYHPWVARRLILYILVHTTVLTLLLVQNLFRKKGDNLEVCGWMDRKTRSAI